MDDIELAIREAWNRVRDDILANRDELRRRVVRMERPDVGRPLREWCLALRGRGYAAARAARKRRAGVGG